MKLRFVCVAAMLLMATTAESRLRAADDIDYLTQIKPLLQAKCYSCHGVLRQESSLRLETRALMVAGGDSGAVLAAGDPDASLILERVTADDDSRMPPSEEGAALKPDEIALLREWIRQGALAPKESIPAAPDEHWAFRPIQKPAPPTTGHPVDVLLNAKRRQHGLRVQPPARRSIAIRRLYLDLIGLPPSREQLADQRPWAEIVDELLASPHHGERWGRHWMDVWRYSDWYGLGAQLRNSQKHMWRWRDWIVNSLNADKGYDRMILEMLAGDELDPDDPESVAGTGFLARNYYLFNRTTWLDSTIEHTGKAFLGLTLNCAKCHDHKYDPISHVDYYSFRAIFEPHQVRLDPVPGETNLERDGLPRAFDDKSDAQTWLHLRGNPKDPDKQTKISPRVPEIFAAFQPPIQPVALPATAFAPATRDYVRTDQFNAAQARIAQAEKTVDRARRRVAEIAAAPAEPVANKAATGSAPFTLHDDFSHANPEVWDVRGAWEYADGTIRRTTVTREPESIRLRRTLPRDFEVTCRYTTTGGATYKSVTFRFDESDDGKYANYVYTSAHAPGPKVQAAFTRGGGDSYPAEGRVARPIRVGRTYELKFAVRDRLVNVWLDNKFVLAYEFPDRRPDGRFAMSGFDATVAFDDIAFRSLPADVKLSAAKNAGTVSPADAAGALKIAEAKLEAERLQFKSIQAVIEADRRRYVTAPDAQTAAGQSVESLSKAAATAQAEALRGQAEYERLAAAGDTKKLNAARTKAKSAQQKLAAIAAGNFEYSEIRASRKALETPAHREADYAATYTATSTGRRLSLARWVTSPQNPLTARVAVNHVWMRHFGEPLVASVFDFGLRAEQPLHADVLDYLAAEFMESGWSFRHLHRLIVTSATYRMSSSTAAADPATQAADRANRFYWRMPDRRMDAQTVRDSLLKLAGTLDTTRGGPSVDVGDKSTRRSLYFKHSRDDQDKFLSMFDDADLLQCYRRSESIVPQQALALANSRLSMTQAARIAASVHASLPSADEGRFVAAAFETLIARPPSAAELSACEQFCAELRVLLLREKQVSAADLDTRVRTRLVHSLLNHNDFVSIR